MRTTSQKIRNPLLHDKLQLSLLIVSGLVNIAGLLWALTHIHKTEMPMPVRYTSLANFDRLGKWYELYYPVAASFIILVVNFTLATFCYPKNKVISLFLMLVALTVAILMVAITFGFTSINYGIS